MTSLFGRGSSAGPFVQTLTPDAATYFLQMGSVFLINKASEMIEFSVVECDAEGRGFRSAHATGPTVSETSDERLSRIRLEREINRSRDRQATLLATVQLPPYCMGRHASKGELNWETEIISKAFKAATSKLADGHLVTFNHSQVTNSTGVPQPTIRAFLGKGGTSDENFARADWASIKFIQVRTGIRPMVTSIPSAWLERLNLASCCLRPKTICDNGPDCTARVSALREAQVMGSPAKRSGVDVGHTLRVERESAKKAKMNEARAELEQAQQAKRAGFCSVFLEGKVNAVLVVLSPWNACSPRLTRTHAVRVEVPGAVRGRPPPANALVTIDGRLRLPRGPRVQVPLWQRGRLPIQALPLVCRVGCFQRRPARRRRHQKELLGQTRLRGEAGLRDGSRHGTGAVVEGLSSRRAKPPFQLQRMRDPLLTPTCMRRCPSEGAGERRRPECGAHPSYRWS